MKNLWALRTIDGRVIADGFTTKEEAKHDRTARGGGDVLFVTPGPDHKRYSPYKSMASPVRGVYKRRKINHGKINNE
jgi:hypothetical protein